MTCKEEMIQRLDQAADEYKFPGWDCGNDEIVIGAMRASGFHSSKGIGLVLEQFGYFLDLGLIRSNAYCFATYPVEEFVSASNGLELSINQADTDELAFGFGNIEVVSRDRSFAIPFIEKEVRARGYLDLEIETPRAVALMLIMLDAIPRNWLFSTLDYLIREFKMPKDTKRLFVLDDWRHPSRDELYGDEIRPSKLPDIVAMVKALCSGSSQPKLNEEPNTSWKKQCKKDDDKV